MKNNTNQVQMPAMSREEEQFITEIEYQGNILRMRLIEARELLSRYGFFVVMGDKTAE